MSEELKTTESTSAEETVGDASFEGDMRPGAIR